MVSLFVCDGHTKTICRFFLSKAKKLKKWQKEITDQLDLIDRLAARRFIDANLAQEAVAFALDALQANSWQRLQSFSGRSSITTFLSSVVLRLFEDFSRKRFGRLRPPHWLQKLGGIWLTLFRLLCQERYAKSEAVDNLTITHGHDRQELEEAATTILAEIHDCGHAKGHSQAMEQDKLDYQSALQHPPDDSESRLSNKEKNLLFSTIFAHLVGKGQGTTLSTTFSKVLQSGIFLTPPEQLLLQLCFQDGVPVSEAGRMLGLSAHQAHGRLRRLLSRIKKDLEKTGVAEELLELLKN